MTIHLPKRFTHRTYLMAMLALLIITTTGPWQTEQVQAAPVPFPNRGFETYPGGGPDDWEWPSSDWVWDGSIAHGGNHSARVSRTAGPGTSKLWSPHVQVEASTAYTLTYWLRTRNASWSPSVFVHQYTSDGTPTGPRLGSNVDIHSASNDWFQVSLRFQTMPDAHHIRLQLYVWTTVTGTFWFDDFALDQGPPALYPFQEGFPVIGSTTQVEFTSPTVADLDGDGDNELLVAGAGGQVDGWDVNGAVLAGFPIETGDKRIAGQLALADLDGDDDLEIIAGTRTPTYGGQGRVFVWHHNGTILSGWPQRVAWLGQYGCAISEVRSVVVADIDGDGDPEVLAGTTNGAPNYRGSNPPPTPNLYAWHANGTLVGGEWPTSHDTAAIYGAIAAGDLTGDSTAEVITGRDHLYLYAYGSRGNFLPGWPVKAFVNGNDGSWSTDLRVVFADSAAAIADLDSDGEGEYIIEGSVKDPDNLGVILNSGLLALNSNGTRLPGWGTAALGDGNLYDELWPLPQKAPAIADLDGDGQLEIVVASYDGWIRAYKADQRLLWAFNFAQADILFASEAVIGDIDGDQDPEIIFGTYDPEKGDGAVGVWGLEANGTVIPGFPLAIGTPGTRAAPTLTDLDGDGDLEILVAARTGEVFAWDTPAPFNPSHLPWPMGRHDLRRSATYERLETGPNLSTSHKFATPLNPRQGETTSFVIRLHNTGSVPFTYTVRLTDVVPAGLSYVPDSLDASLGTFDDSGGLLTWSGVMDNNRVVDITYDTTVTTGAIELITNTVTIDTGINGRITRSGSIIANGWQSFTPFIAKKLYNTTAVNVLERCEHGPDCMHQLYR